MADVESTETLRARLTTYPNTQGLLAVFDTFAEIGRQKVQVKDPLQEAHILAPARDLPTATLSLRAVRNPRLMTDNVVGLDLYPVPYCSLETANFSNLAPYASFFVGEYTLAEGPEFRHCGSTIRLDTPFARLFSRFYTAVFAAYLFT